MVVKRRTQKPGLFTLQPIHAFGLLQCVVLYSGPKSHCRGLDKKGTKSDYPTYSWAEYLLPIHMHFNKCVGHWTEPEFNGQRICGPLLIISGPAQDMAGQRSRMIQRCMIIIIIIVIALHWCMFHQLHSCFRCCWLCNNVSGWPEFNNRHGHGRGPVMILLEIPMTDRVHWTWLDFGQRVSRYLAANILYEMRGWEISYLMIKSEYIVRK